MLEQLKAKIAALEIQAQQAMSNHSYLAGALAALKEMLSIAEVVAPASPVVEGLKVAETVAEDVEKIVEPTPLAE